MLDVIDTPSVSALDTCFVMLDIIEQRWRYAWKAYVILRMNVRRYWSRIGTFMDGLLDNAMVITKNDRGLLGKLALQCLIFSRAGSEVALEPCCMMPDSIENDWGLLWKFLFVWGDCAKFLKKL